MDLTTIQRNKYFFMDEIKTKVCSNKNCVHGGKPQPLTNFNKHRGHKDGLTSNCKDCIKAQKDKYYVENREKVLADQKKYVEENHEKILERHKKYYQEHIDERLEYQANYYEENHDKILENSKIYRDNHKEDIKEYKANYYEENKDNVSKKQKEYNESLALYDSCADKLMIYEEVQKDKDNSDLLQVRCKYCGRWFNPTNLQVKNRLASINSGFINGERNFYCSDSCKKSCPSYRQRKYPKGFKQNTSREVQPELRKMVLARDNWTCQKCGKSKDEFPELELHCHHMFPINEDPVGSADMDNCITYCKECHKWVHMNVPGCGYNEMKCSE